MFLRPNLRPIDSGCRYQDLHSRFMSLAEATGICCIALRHTPSGGTSAGSNIKHMGAVAPPLPNNWRNQHRRSKLKIKNAIGKMIQPTWTDERTFLICPGKILGIQNIHKFHNYQPTQPETTGHLLLHISISNKHTI